MVGIPAAGVGAVARPAARVGDRVEHRTPSGLTPGPGSHNVFINGKPAWRGLPLIEAPALIKAQESAEKVRNPLARVGVTPVINNLIANTARRTGADIHTCSSSQPMPPPHGSGVVIDGSKTVLINNLPACRQGDTVLEAMGPKKHNKIARGEPTVRIGG